jgi:pyruvate/2-oxoglutarate dehydrogenase complex dihydrolipoamide dehydrogenase (E3) component
MEEAMPQPDQFQILILGSGTGGKLVAWHMAQAGRRTAVVERRWIGGSCPNIACMPSKNEISSARVAYLVRHAAEFGWRISPPVIDMGVVRQRKRDMVQAQVTAHAQNYKASGAELIMGTGHFTAPKTIEVNLNDGGTRVLTGDQIFINVGTQATIPNVPGLQPARPLTNIEALELDYLPPHLIVLGGGYVGLELAQAYRRFGSQVTVIEYGPQIMGREDRDVADEIQRILSDEGIEFIVGAEVIEVRGRSGEDVSLVVRWGSGKRTIEGSDILVAAGRTPHTAGIGLEEAGVELDDRGYIRVNDRLETTAPAVWAIGECAGSPQFTHVSEDDFRIIRDNLAGGKRSTRDRLVPYRSARELRLGEVPDFASKRPGFSSPLHPVESVQRRLGKNCPARFGALGEKLTLARRKPSSKKRKPNLSKSARSSLAIWAEGKQPRLLLSKKRKSSGRVVGEPTSVGRKLPAL